MSEPIPLDPDVTTWKKDDVFKPTSTHSNEDRRYRLIDLVGTGASSLVWLAEELQPDGTVRRKVALKVLRPDAGREFSQALVDEHTVMRNLWKAMRKQGIENPFIPEVYDFSLPDAKSHFISMELLTASDLDGLVGRKTQLDGYIQTAMDDGGRFSASFDILRERLSAEGHQELLPLGKKIEHALEQVRVDLQELEKGILSLPVTETLNEEELITAMIQAAQVVQCLNEECKYSFKDFQLKNLIYDRTAKQLKIMDWNVLSAYNKVSPEADIFKLASGIFNLISRNPLKEPTDRETLYQTGGHVWLDGISQPVRQVCERSLVKHQQGFSKAYEWEAQPGLQPVSSVPAFGNALEMTRRYLEASVQELIRLGETCIKKGLLDDAAGLVEIAGAKVETVPAEIRRNLETDLARIRKEILSGRSMAEDLIKNAQDWMRTKDRKNAGEAIQKAMKANPHSLEIRRWDALIRAVRDIPYDEFCAIWETGRIQSGMADLLTHNWRRAKEFFSGVHQLADSLLVDAELNAGLSQLRRAYVIFSRSGNVAAAGEFLQSYRQFHELNIRHKLDYADLILQQWPDLSEWQDRAQRFIEEEMERNEARAAVKKLSEQL